MNEPAPCSGIWRHRCVLLVVWGPITLLLCSSYVFLAVLHGNWNLFPVVIHENGKYTLAETIFYFRHFVREILPTSLIALAALATFNLSAPATGGTSVYPGYIVRASRAFAIGLIAFLVVTIGLAVIQQGGGETLEDFFQFRTRDDRAEYGTHWQYHLLHMLDAALFSLGFTWFVRGLSGHDDARMNPIAIRLLAGWGGLFVIFTAVFSPDARPFTDPLYLAHQFREIATSRLLLIPAVFGLLYALESRLPCPTARPAFDRKQFFRGLKMLSFATLIPIWIWWRLRDVNVLSLAQKQRNLVELYAAHNFEHCLDVLFALLLAGWLYLRLFPKELKPEIAPI